MLAARAGARLSDLEFIQFHPTAFDGPHLPMQLVTEAVRGDGAILIDETGQRFMADQPGAELAPRDIVARAVWRRRAEGHRVFLDARKHPGAEFAKRYPVISAFCKMAGIDPATDPIPVRPAAHYHMGGISVDVEGRSSVNGLWACGEVSRTGLHGANRLASNSLMEAIVCAQWVAESVSSARRSPLKSRVALAPPTASDPSAVRPILSQSLGVLRDGHGIERGIRSLYPHRNRPWRGSRSGAGRIDDRGCRLAARGKPRRTLSVSDYPDALALAVPSSLTLADALETARSIVETRSLSVGSAQP